MGEKISLFMQHLHGLSYLEGEFKAVLQSRSLLPYYFPKEFNACHLNQFYAIGSLIAMEHFLSKLVVEWDQIIKALIKPNPEELSKLMEMDTKLIELKKYCRSILKNIISLIGNDACSKTLLEAYMSKINTATHTNISAISEELANLEHEKNQALLLLQATCHALLDKVLELQEIVIAKKHSANKPENMPFSTADYAYIDGSKASIDSLNGFLKRLEAQRVILNETISQKEKQLTLPIFFPSIPRPERKNLPVKTCSKITDFFPIIKDQKNKKRPNQESTPEVLNKKSSVELNGPY